MKIAIEARAITGTGGGVRRYVKNLLKAVNGLPDNIDLSVVIDQNAKLDLKGIEKIVIPRYGKVGLKYWLNSQVSRQLTKRNVELVHYTKADVPNNKTLPTVVTIYDVIPLLYPKSQKFLDKIYWSQALPRAAAKSDKIITISDQSKKDIVRKLGVPEEKIVVTKLGIDTAKFRFTAVKAEKTPFLLYVGTIEPKKNIASLIKSFSLIKNDFSHNLVIVGRRYKGYAALRQLTIKEGIADRVEWKNNVDDDELINLYGQASLFVWPSIYEGWGFPPQEAMACGTPVIVSDGGALPEVVGNAGIIVKFGSNNIRDRDSDFGFVQRLAAAIGTVLTNKELQEKLRAKGKAQARKYTWENVAKATVGVYREILNKQ